MNTEDSEFERIEREQAMRGVPDAIHHTDTSETLEYIQGWNDCRQAMLAEQPAQQEPFEYWNAVEGWVKIDEVRQHFDSVGCGTIYKTPGDGRVPLTTAQRTWVGLTDKEANKLWESTDSDWELMKRTEAKLKEKNNG